MNIINWVKEMRKNRGYWFKHDYLFKDRLIIDNILSYNNVGFCEVCGAYTSALTIKKGIKTEEHHTTYNPNNPMQLVIEYYEEKTCRRCREEEEKKEKKEKKNERISI